MMTSPQLSRDQVPVPLGEAPRLVRALIYGDFGSGKSTLVAKIIEALGIKALAITADSCWPAMLKVPGADIERLSYKSYGGSSEETKTNAYGQLLEVAKKLGDGSRYQAIDLDPVSSMIDIGRRHYTRVKKFADQRDKDVSSWTHFNLVKDKFTDTIEVLTATQCHVFYVCHARFPSEEEKSKARGVVRPSPPEQTFVEIAKECNLIAYCFKENRGEKRKVQTEGTLKEVAKSQIPTVPEGIFPQEELPGLIQEWVK